MLSRSSAATAGDGWGTQSRLSRAVVLFTQGALPIPTATVFSVRVIVGVAPHVTATLATSVLFVNAGSGPRTNPAAPAGGGVRLSRSAGRKPYWNLLDFFERSAATCRAGWPRSILSRSKTFTRPATCAVPAALKTWVVM